MGRLDNFENRIEHVVDDAAGAMFKSPLNPVQIMRRAEKEMSREKLVSAGRQYAPTLYNVLVNTEDDHKLAGFYPTLAGELETDLKGKAADNGLHMDGAPLVRFIVDDGLKRGKFDIIAENVAAPIVAQLREEEMERYGLAGASTPPPGRRQGAAAARSPYPQAPIYPEPSGSAAYEPLTDDGLADEDASWDGYGSGLDEDDRLASIPACAAAVPPSRPGKGAQERYNRVPSTVRFDTGAARLVNARTGETYTLSGMRLSLGRERNNNIPIRDANISRSHAELVNDNGRWTIRDLGSTNGTQVNDRAVSQCELHDGDTITVGMTVLEFREG